MKKALSFFTFLLLLIPVFSQDLIVTKEGDSINCKITKVKPDYIYFTFKYADEIRSTLLPVSGIKNHQINYFPESEVPKEKVIGIDNFQHFRFAIHGGYSYNTARVAESVPDNLKDYVRKLKSGGHFGGDVTYYFTESFGFGVKSCILKSSNVIYNIYVQPPGGGVKQGKLSDNIAVSFIGPSFSTRLLNHTKSNSFLMNLSMGYMGFSDNKLIVDKYKMTGNTIGFVYELGYDLGLSENMSLGFQLSIISGYLSEYYWDDGITKELIELENNEYESLTRIDFTVGLRFHK